MFREALGKLRLSPGRFGRSRANDGNSARFRPALLGYLSISQRCAAERLGSSGVDGASFHSHRSDALPHIILRPTWGRALDGAWRIGGWASSSTSLPTRFAVHLGLEDRLSRSEIDGGSGARRRRRCKAERLLSWSEPTSSRPRAIIETRRKGSLSCIQLIDEAVSFEFVGER